MWYKATNIWAHYGSAEVLKDINIELNEGEIVTLIGANGAGKTTFLRTLSGLKSMSSGEIEFQGERIEKCSPREMVTKGIGHVLEGRRLFPHMTVLENLQVGAHLRKNSKEVEKDMENVFNYFPILRERAKQIASTLSGGQQQMVAIGRALMINPRILMMDEPSIGLSPIVVQEMGKIIRNINKEGVSILLVEQNARLALGLAHRCYVLEVGKIVIEGKAEDLAEDERVKTAYLGL